MDMERIIALYMDDCHSRQLRSKTKKYQSSTQSGGGCLTRLSIGGIILIEFLVTIYGSCRQLCYSIIMLPKGLVICEIQQ